jgi:hypothetical protein
LADGKVMETLTSGSRALQEVVFETWSNVWDQGSGTAVVCEMWLATDGH